MKGKIIVALLVFVAVVGGGYKWIKSHRHSPPKVTQELVTWEPAIAENRRNLARELVGLPPKADRVEVPFVSLSVPHHDIRALYSPALQAVSLDVNDQYTLSFGKPAVPVGVVELDSPSLAVVWREVYSNRLWLAVHTPDQPSPTQSIELSHSPDARLFYRGARLIGNELYLVGYDNKVQKNYLLTAKVTHGRVVLAPDQIELPTLEDPAGTHYEMEPPLFLFNGEKGRLRLVGGTLDAVIGTEGVVEQRRLENCLRAVEAIATSDGIAVLCEKKAGNSAASYSLLETGKSPVSVPPDQGVPFALKWDSQAKKVVWRYATTTRDYGELYEYDLLRGQNSGFLEFGSSNQEGRVAWSQIYYLNGMLDVVKLAQYDEQAYETYAPLLSKLRLRIDLEMSLLDGLLGTSYHYRTKAFSVNREEELFSVQTSRLLLLMDRYRNELPDPLLLRHYDEFKQQVLTLRGHIDQPAADGQREGWSKPGELYLHWAKGTSFYYDGAPVPYNHQNEWAYSVFEIERQGGQISDQKTRRLSRDVVSLYARHMLKDGRFPTLDKWDYWWGYGKDGWTAESGLSEHMPSYGGDTTPAWISFRTIDVMSILAASDVVDGLDKKKLVESAAGLVERGEIYPFAALGLIRAGHAPAFQLSTLQRYARALAPSDLANTPWALARLPAEAEPEDPNSRLLNAQVLSRWPDIGQVRSDSPEAAQAMYDYLSVALPWNAGQALRFAGKELGGKYLAWNLAYDLRATLIAYERTHDKRFLDIFVPALDIALRMRDDRLGMHDDLHGRVMKAWGSNRYSADKKDWIVWDAFSGMVLYPAVRYCNIVAAKDQVEGRCKAYVRDAVETLKEFDAQWRDDPLSGGGYYYDPYYKDVAPLNHMNTLGLVHVELARRADASSEHRDRVSALMKFFRYHWKPKENSTVEWEYWAGATKEEYKSTLAEDVSHAQINVHFAVEAASLGLVPDSDLQLLADTWRLNIRKSPNDWATSVGGTGDMVKDGLHEAISGWIVLSPYDSSAPAALDVFIEANKAAFPLGRLSYATGPISFAYGLPAFTRP